jgi:hypothetical protein
MSTRHAYGGTFDIIYASNATLIAYVWTYGHVNVPEEGAGRTAVVLRKLQTAMFKLLFPEVMIAIAAEERERAAKLARIMRNAYGIEPAQSSLAKAWRWCLGKLPMVLQPGYSNQDIKLTVVDIDSSKVQRTRAPNTSTHGYVTAMGIFAYECRVNTPDLRPGNMDFVTTNDEGLSLLRSHFPGTLPRISKDSLRERSTSTMLAKALAC